MQQFYISYKKEEKFAQSVKSETDRHGRGMGAVNMRHLNNERKLILLSPIEMPLFWEAYDTATGELFTPF